MDPSKSDRALIERKMKIDKQSVYSIAIFVIAVACSPCSSVFACDGTQKAQFSTEIFPTVRSSTGRFPAQQSIAIGLLAAKPVAKKAAPTKKSEPWNSDLSKMMDQIDSEVKEPGKPPTVNPKGAVSTPGTASNPGTATTPGAPESAGSEPTVPHEVATSKSENSASDLIDETAPGALPPEPGSATELAPGADATTPELESTKTESASPPDPGSTLPVTAIPESDKSANDYFEQVKEVGLARWTSSRLPIKVYIESNSKVPGFRPEFVTILRLAFKDWEQASGGKISTEFIDTANGAAIACLWTDDASQMMSTKEGGNTILVPDPQGIVRADMKILTQPPLGVKTMPANFMRRVCLHEAGHALGLTGHSTESGDIMYDTVFLNEKPANLTARDKNTLIALYMASDETIAANKLDPLRAVVGSAGALKKDSPDTPGPMGSSGGSTGSFPNTPAGIPTRALPENPKAAALQLSNEAALALQQANFPVALAKLEQANKLDSTNPLIKSNLGAVYANFGSIAGMTMNLPVAAQYFKKAIPLLEASNNPGAYRDVLSNYIKVLERTNDQVELKKMQAKMAQISK